MTTQDKQMEEAVDALLRGILGDAWDPINNPHMKDTPKRYVKALKEILVPGDGFNFTTFPNSKSTTEMVIVGPIRYHSVCAHHVLPFFGNSWIAYIPDKKIAGLSKLARTVKWMSKGLWTQEDLTSEIATFLEEELDPIGVAVRMEGEHLCMTIRGVQSPESVTTTSELRGAFLNPRPGANPRQEFYNAIIR
jgi:GTP cyclohydrolase I